MVFADDAFQDRTHEKGGTHLEVPQGAYPQLVQGQRRAFIGCRRGVQQQGETRYEKSLRVSHLRGDPTRPVPSTWSVTYRTNDPRILLTRHKFEGQCAL